LDDDVCLAYVTDSLGRQQKTFVINESGLYTLIIRSDKPQDSPCDYGTIPLLVDWHLCRP